MSDSSWVLVDKTETEKNVKDVEIDISLKYRHSNELLAQRLHDTEVRDNVTYSETKHIPQNMVSNNLSESDDSDTDEYIMSDIAGSWEDGGAWEKYDLSGMSIIPYDHWQKRIRDWKNSNKYVTIQKKRKILILELLSSNPAFQVYKKRYINPRIFVEPVRYRSLVQKVKDRKNDKIATEFFEALDEYTVNLIDKMIRNGILKKVKGILDIQAKNYVLLHAESGHNCESESQNFVLKIYKKTFIQYVGISYVSRCVFVTDWEKPIVHKLSRGVPISLAAKERSVLEKLRNIGSPSLEVVDLPNRLKRHIVVMSFTGNDKEISTPKLKEIYVEHEKWVKAFEEEFYWIRS